MSCEVALAWCNLLHRFIPGLVVRGLVVRGRIVSGLLLGMALETKAENR